MSIVLLQQNLISQGHTKKILRKILFPSEKKNLLCWIQFFFIWTKVILMNSKYENRTSLRLISSGHFPLNSLLTPHSHPLSLNIYQWRQRETKIRFLPYSSEEKQDHLVMNVAPMFNNSFWIYINRSLISIDQQILMTLPPPPPPSTSPFPPSFFDLSRSLEVVRSSSCNPPSPL